MSTIIPKTETNLILKHISQRDEINAICCPLYPPPKDANRAGGYSMKLSTYYTIIVHQAEWNQSKGEIEGKNP